MNAFILKFLLFVLPIIAFISYLEIMYGQIPNEYSYKNSILEKRKDSISTLIVGPSYLWRGVNPTLLGDEIFNLSFPGQSLQMDLDLIKYYTRKIKNLKTIVISFSYNDLRMAKRPSELRKTYIKRYFSYIPHGFFLSDLNAKTMIKKIIPFSVRGKNPEIYSDYNGFRRTTKKQNLSDTLTIQLVKSESTTNRNLVNNNKFILKRIVQIAEQNNLQIVLLTPPFYVGYRDHINHNQYIEMQNFARSLSEENDFVYWLNLFDSNRFDAEHFLDATHLNNRGAKLLTTILGKFLEKKMIITNTKMNMRNEPLEGQFKREAL
jgi:hypothetical protein